MNYTVAFVGNPNVGKSAWINALSNAHFQVGNWPGVTIERKEAVIDFAGDSYHLIDLPGVYSLDEQTNEEAVTSRFLAEEKIDCIVNVVDASNLSRNLMLTVKLRELNISMVLLFNFMDEVKKQNIVIDQAAISHRLGLPIYAGSAFDHQREPLMKQIQQACRNQSFYHPLLDAKSDRYFVYLFDLIHQAMPELDDRQAAQAVYACFEGKAQALKQLMDQGLKLESLNQMTMERLEKNQIEAVASCMRYVSQRDEKRYHMTHKIDAVLLNRWLSYPLLILFFVLLLMIVFNGSRPYIDFINQFFNEFLANYIRFYLDFLPVSILDLIISGVLGGVGGVLSFLPLMALLFFFLGILEESGYMARVAFLLDKAMRAFHLSGKAFLTLLIGFGCNVPAIYATRTLDNQKQKELCATLIPFMSCSARLPVYMLFASAFFPDHTGAAIITVIGFGILMALILALVVAHFKGHQETTIFLLELPVYRMPRLSVLLQKVVREVKSFIHKAFTAVLLTMMLLWALSYFPNGDVKTSYIADFSRHAAVLFEPLGFGTSWEAVASLPAGISAKESVVGFLSQCLLDEEPERIEPEIGRDLREQGKLLLNAVKESTMQLFTVEKQEGNKALNTSIQQLFTDRYAPLRAFSFMVYICLTIPCIMAMNALYQEYGWKLLLRSIIIMLIVPYVVCLLLFQGLSLLL